MSPVQRGSTLGSYANTPVPPYKTKDDIEKLLQRVGAKGFRWSSYPKREVLEAALAWKGSNVAFRLSIEFADEPRRKQTLRVLHWYLKAKIEAIQFGLVDLEREFLPYLLTPGGKTVYDDMQLRQETPWKLIEAPLDD